MAGIKRSTATRTPRAVAEWSERGMEARPEPQKRHPAGAHRGTREQLIAAGIVKAEHFPGQPGCGKWSTRFWPKGGRKFRVSCNVHPALRSADTMYEVDFYQTREERREQRAEERAEFEIYQAARAQHESAEAQQQGDQGCGEDEARRLRKILDQLPAFVPGSMSESEKRLMRLVRGLEGHMQEAVCSFVGNLLLETEPDTTGPETPQPGRRGLTLVVDNTRR